MSIEAHECNFSRFKRKVTLIAGSKKAIDILLVWKCKCGIERGADILERREF